MQATATGDRAAFGRLVARHQAAVFRFARWMTGERTSAEDVLQETFLAALRGAAGYRGDASVRGWLLTIARHAAWRRLRRTAPRPTDDASLERLGLEAGWGRADGPDASLEARRRRESLERALASLEPDDREVLVLRDLEELSGEEAATALGIGLPAVKSRLHRARLRLAAALRPGEDQ